MTYLYKGLVIERRGTSLWPVGDDYEIRYHEFTLLNKREQEKYRK